MPHPLLRRQIQRCGLADAPPVDAARWHELIDRIAKAYHEADDERRLQEQMLDTLSAEMLQLNDSLRASEARLAEERDRLQAVVTCVGDGLCVLDLEGRCRFVNTEGRRLIGAQSETLALHLRDLC